MATIKLGDKVIRDGATAGQGKVRLGDEAPVFVRTIRAGDKVQRQDETKVRLGDEAPVFVRPIRAGDKVQRQDQTKVRLGDEAPVF